MYRCARDHYPRKGSKALRQEKASPSLHLTGILLERDITIVDTHGIWPHAQFKQPLFVDFDESLEFRSRSSHICVFWSMDVDE